MKDIHNIASKTETTTSTMLENSDVKELSAWLNAEYP